MSGPEPASHVLPVRGYLLQRRQNHEDHDPDPARALHERLGRRARIELGPQPDGALWARFTGAEGVREFLDGEMDEFFRRMPASAAARAQ